MSFLARFSIAVIAVAALAAFSVGAFVPTAAAFKPFSFAFGTFFASFAFTAMLFLFFTAGFRPNEPSPGECPRRFSFLPLALGGFFAAFVFLCLKLFVPKPAFEPFGGEMTFALALTAGSFAAGVLFALVFEFPARFFGRGSFPRSPEGPTGSEATSGSARV